MGEVLKVCGEVSKSFNTGLSPTKMANLFLVRSKKIYLTLFKPLALLV